MTDTVPEIVTSSAEPVEAGEAKEAVAPAVESSESQVVGLFPEGLKKRSVSPAAVESNGKAASPARNTSPVAQIRKSPPKAPSPAGGADSADEPAKSGNEETATTVNGEVPAGASVSGSEVPQEAAAGEAEEVTEAKGEEEAKTDGVKRGGAGRGRGRGRGRGASRAPATPRAPKPKSEQAAKERKPGVRDNAVAAKEAAELVGSDVSSMPRLRSASRKVEPPKPAAKRPAQTKKGPPAKRGKK